MNRAIYWALPQRIQQEKKMDKDRDSVVNLMTRVFQNGNKMMCIQSGMSEEETEEKMGQSLPSITYLMGLVFDKLDENNLIVE